VAAHTASISSHTSPSRRTAACLQLDPGVPTCPPYAQLAAMAAGQHWTRDRARSFSEGSCHAKTVQLPSPKSPAWGLSSIHAPATPTPMCSTTPPRFAQQPQPQFAQPSPTPAKTTPKLIVQCRHARGPLEECDPLQGVKTPRSEAAIGSADPISPTGAHAASPTASAHAPPGGATRRPRCWPLEGRVGHCRTHS
jgi:hypothetical protein